jgi:hypothetical protein
MLDLCTVLGIPDHRRSITMTRTSTFLFLAVLATASAFAPIAPRTTTRSASMNMMDPTAIQDSIQTTSMLLAETEPWVQPLYSVLDPFFNLFSFAMVRFKKAKFVFIICVGSYRQRC